MEKRCGTCRHYLGGGMCALSMEMECADGGYEAWEEDRNHGGQERVKLKVES